MNQPIATKHDLDKVEFQIRSDLAAQQNALSNLVLSSAVTILTHLIHVENPTKHLTECKAIAAKELKEALDQTNQGLV
jgi:hypothetical protein